MRVQHRGDLCRALHISRLAVGPVSCATLSAAYCDERSVEAFARRVGSVYPAAISISGRGKVWLKDDLDRAIPKLSGAPVDVVDAADLL